MPASYWLHILTQLLWGFQHIHCTHHLMVYYVHHHAVAFLRSGITSQSPANATQARHLLTWLLLHHISPVDW